MAIEVLGLPESFDSHATEVLVEAPPRDGLLHGFDESSSASLTSSAETTMIIGGSVIAIAALALWASQWFWPRKDR